MILSCGSHSDQQVLANAQAARRWALRITMRTTILSS